MHFVVSTLNHFHGDSYLDTRHHQPMYHTCQRRGLFFTCPITVSIRAITLFRFIIVFYGIDNLPQNILGYSHNWVEYENILQMNVNPNNIVMDLNNVMILGH